MKSEPRLINQPSKTGDVGVPARAGSVIAIDLAALQRNYRWLAKRARPAVCAASLKANAYGIGLVAAGPALYAAGCRVFLVAYPEEGRTLRATLGADGSSEAAIYVLCGLMAGESAFYDRYRLRPVLAGPAELAEWSAYCRQQQRRLPAAIHIETGMNRLAFTDSQVAELVAGSSPCESFELVLVLSHLACADEEASEFNALQRQRFDYLRARLPQACASLANSAGIFLGDRYHYDLVRPGIALYGGTPVEGRENSCEPVAYFFAKILQVRDITAGARVGYGGSWTAGRASRIAVLGAGYGDGYPRSLGTPADGYPTRVRIGEYFAPLIGRVSMDLITVDVTELPLDAVERGGVAELIGDHVTVDEVAKKAATNSFEILTRLGIRCPRLYSGFDSC